MPHGWLPCHRPNQADPDARGIRHVWEGSRSELACKRTDVDAACIARRCKLAKRKLRDAACIAPSCMQDCGMLHASPSVACRIAGCCMHRPQLHAGVRDAACIAPSCMQDCGMLHASPPVACRSAGCCMRCDRVWRGGTPGPSRNRAFESWSGSNACHQSAATMGGLGQ